MVDSANAPRASRHADDHVADRGRSGLLARGNPALMTAEEGLAERDRVLRGGRRRARKGARGFLTHKRSVRAALDAIRSRRKRRRALRHEASRALQQESHLLWGDGGDAITARTD